MGILKNDKCYSCPVRNTCEIVVEPGSIMCILNRMKSGKTHGEEQKFCPHCGKQLN